MGIETILNLLSNYNLTADELLLVYLTFMARDEEGHSEYFVRWFNTGGALRLRDLFESLKKKGVIRKDYNPESYVPNEIEFNKNFEKSWLKNSLSLGQELFDAYPSFLRLDGGKMVPIKNIAKRFGSLEEFFFFYSSQIKHNPEKHNEIMELLNWAKEHNKITFGICEFVISHKWEELKELKNSDFEGEVASTFDAYDMV